MTKRAVVGDVCLNLNEPCGLDASSGAAVDQERKRRVAGLVISTGALVGVGLSDPVT
ncbi:MAG TPA: hypothetical protein VEF35_06240 [Candidatus Bathyarchaeia archaeon]|nr:hypothetical protein [Candidatus Bathyarchaeia archaeon]